MSGDAATELLREELAQRLCFNARAGYVTIATADLVAVVEAECRRRAAEELRRLSHDLAFTPLSQREAGVVSDYTAGMHAAGRIAELRADAIEGRP